jgi:hypothetical protein
MREARVLASARRDGERLLSRCGSPHACGADTTCLPGSLLRSYFLIAFVRCPLKLLLSRPLRITREGQALAAVAHGGPPGAWRCGQNSEAAGTGCRGVSLTRYETGGVAPCAHNWVHRRTVCWSSCRPTRRQSGQYGSLCTRLCACVPRRQVSLLIRRWIWGTRGAVPPFASKPGAGVPAPATPGQTTARLARRDSVA